MYDALYSLKSWLLTLPAGSYPSDRAKVLFDVNVHGAFYTAREAARYMIPAGGGSIILVASMSAVVRIKFYWCCGRL